MQDGLHSWHSVQLTPEHALEVAALLERAWSVPSLHYTPEFIAWQMSFPGSPPFVGFRADRGNWWPAGARRSGKRSYRMMLRVRPFSWR